MRRAMLSTHVHHGPRLKSLKCQGDVCSATSGQRDLDFLTAWSPECSPSQAQMTKGPVLPNWEEQSGFSWTL